MTRLTHIIKTPRRTQEIIKKKKSNSEDTNTTLSHAERKIIQPNITSIGCQTVNIETFLPQTKKTKEQGVQANVDEFVAITDIKERLQNGKDITGVLEQKWPEEIFEKVRIISENPAKYSDNRVTVMLVNPEDKLGGIPKGISDKYADLAELTESEINENDVEFLEYNTNLKVSNGTVKEKKTRLYMALCNNRGNDTIIKTVNNIKEEMTAAQVKSFAVTTWRGLDCDKVRKIFESIFHTSIQEIAYHVPQKIYNDLLNNKKTGYSDILIVRGKGGKSFVDILKTIKNGVDIINTNIEVEK